MPGGGASTHEIEQLRQQELTLYRQILTLSDAQEEALAPDAREQVCQALSFGIVALFIYSARLGRWSHKRHSFVC